MCPWVWLLRGRGEERRYMMWVYGGNRSHYATTRTRLARLHLLKPWSPLSKHQPYKLQPVHTIRLMSERICLSSQLIWAPSCVVKREWVTISLPAKSPLGDSMGRKLGQYHRPIFGFHWDLWIIVETWIIPDTGWRSERFFCQNTHTHTLCELRYQHALVSRALAQSSTTQWLNRRYSEESLLSPVGASLYYTIIWRSSLHATMPRNIRCNIMWNLQVLWLFYDHQGILFSLCHIITSFVLKYCVSCKNKKSLKCISTPHTLSQ